MNTPNVPPRYTNTINAPQSYWDAREKQAICKGYWEQGKRGPELDDAVKVYLDQRQKDRIAFEQKFGK